jgi:hypothetical protein
MSNQLFTKSQFSQLIANGELPHKDYAPVARLYLTNSNSQWLITELFYKHNMAYGITDFGDGTIRTGLINLSKIRGLQDDHKKLEADHTFAGRYKMSVYSRAAKKAARIVTDEQSLVNAEAETTV